MSEEEVILWTELRLLKQQGLHFRRQVPRGPYVLDFACLRAGVAVEVDGTQHFLGTAPQRDTIRDAYFSNLGFMTLRYTTTDVRKSLNSVVSDIFERTSARLFPSPRGEGGLQGRVG